MFSDGATGTSINATLHNAPGIVTFSSLESLETQANGQARIFANDGVLNNPITIAYAGGLISKLELNVNALSSGDVTFKFAGGNSDGLVLGSYGLGSNGSDFFNAFNGTFQSVTLSFGSGATVEDIRQVRMTTAPAVPEPATWATMLLGFGLIGGAMRSARRRPKLAATPA